MRLFEFDTSPLLVGLVATTSQLKSEIDAGKVDNEVDGDIKVDCTGCSLFVDPKSSAYVQGLEIDFVRNGLNEGFEFNNPNERDRCGCGESFRV